MTDLQPSGSLRRLDPDDLGDHLDRLFRAAWALCGNRDDAEDLVQETYASVLARPRFLRSQDDLGYLLGVLRNAHVSRIRSNARRPQTTELQDRPDLRAGADPQFSSDVHAMFDAIGELPLEFREALVAIDLVGLTYREAARALRVREATITTRLHRARHKVAASMKGDEG